MMINRRRTLQLGLGAGVLPFIGCDRAASPSAANPLFEEDAFTAYIKTIGTLETRDVYVWFTGVLWGMLPRVATAPLCGFQGLARHRWHAHGDGSYSQTAYDVGFFSDLETGKPADAIINPLTGESVRPFHNSYGGFEQVHTPAAFAKGRDGSEAKKDQLTWTTAGNQVVLTERMVGNVPSKLQPAQWPRETSGPVNFYGGETSYAASLPALSNPAVKTLPYTLFWSSFAPWEPWLMMDGAKGACQWRATGMKLDRYGDAGQDILDFAEKVQPGYFGDGAPWDWHRSATDDYIRIRGAG